MYYCQKVSSYRLINGKDMTIIQKPTNFLMLYNLFRSRLHRTVGMRERPSNRVESVTNIKSSVNLLGWNFMAFYPSECKYEDIWKISELNNSYICGLIRLHREYMGVRLHILAFTWRNYK